jgi:hypothetical protein
MNIHVDPVSGIEELRLVGKPKRAASKRTSKPKSYAELGAEHRAAVSIVNDVSIQDDKIGEKYHARAWNIAKQTANSALPMSRSDEVVIARMIVESSGGSFDSFESEVSDTGFGPLLCKLIKNIIASSGTDA